jgi:hypothetical protein
MMLASVQRFLKGDQYQPTTVEMPSREEKLHAQAVTATRFLNSKLIRPKLTAIKLHVETGCEAVAWYYKKPGRGRARRCKDMEEAMYLQMDIYKGGRIGPLFK